MSTLLLAALLLLAAPAPAALPVAAAQRADGAIVVAWPAVPGQAVACVLRKTPDQLIGCVLGGATRYQLGPGSVDGNLRLRAGDVVEVRSWGSDGALLARGEGGVFGRVRWLPIVGN